MGTVVLSPGGFGQAKRFVPYAALVLSVLCLYTIKNSFLSLI